MTLSGKVAILNAAGTQVLSIRDLGPTPVDVKPTARPLVENIPALGPGERLDAVTYQIRANDVLATWTKLDAATVTDMDKEAQMTAIDGVILKGLFNHENRIRTLAGQASITIAQFRAALKAML